MSKRDRKQALADVREALCLAPDDPTQALVFLDGWLTGGGCPPLVFVTPAPGVGGPLTQVAWADASAGADLLWPEDLDLMASVSATALGGWNWYVYLPVGTKEVVDESKDYNGRSPTKEEAMAEAVEALRDRCFWPPFRET